MRAANFALILLLFTSLTHAGEQWSKDQANQWYAKQPWLVGSNFVPSTAINQPEMCQGGTFDPKTIDRELGWAQSIGMNTARIFLHDLPGKEDGEGFLSRVDQVLDIAAKHHIRPILVFFDGVWDPDPQSGPQRRPRTGVHNSGWGESAGRGMLDDHKQKE